MKIALIVATALAVGGSAFAAEASQGEGQHVASASFSAAKSKATKVVKKHKKRSIQAKAAHKNARAARLKKRQRTALRSASVKVAYVSPKRAGKTAKRQRVTIDSMKTASIGQLRDMGREDGRQDRTVVAGAGPAAFNPIISRYAREYGVPVSLAHAVIKVESNYRPSARGSAGEIGLMQIKPDTARMLGYTGSARGLYDPATNIRFGMKYLAMAHDLGGGDTCGTILRYNAGHAAKRMNPVSAAYCRKVKQNMAGL